MPRLAGDWLDAYMDYTRNSEPPAAYHRWLGLSMLAAALQRKVYIQWYMSRLHTNMFVVLVGPSGKARKGTAMSFALDILRQVSSIRLVAQKITEQQLIKDLAESTNEFVNPVTGKMEMHCSMTVMSGELAVFLGSANIDFLATLTDIYDSQDEWEYRTKTSGKDKIKGVCFNFLGSTAPDWITSMIPQAAMGGGFTSRIIFIVEHDKRKSIADPTPTPRQWRLREQLITDLGQIHTLEGELKMDDQAMEAYEHWYLAQDRNPPFSTKKLEGYCSRRATHVRKLAMVLSASRSDEMIVRIEDFNRAVQYLKEAEVNMPAVYTSMERTRTSDIAEAVLEFITRKQGRVSKADILSNFFPYINADDLESAMVTLTIMHGIQEVVTPTDVEYEVVGNC